MTNSKLSSDEIKEMDCEHCKRDGCRGIPATGFCEDCCDFVCDTCLRYHRRYEPDHIFKQTNEVEVLREFFSEMCDKHSDEIIKFYCETCDDVACSVCKQQYHFNCSSLFHLSKYRTNLEDTKGTDLVAFINASKAKLHSIRENVEHGMKFGNTLRDNAKVAVKKLREMSDKEFDMLETEIDELELPDQVKLQASLKDVIETEKYISRVNLSSEGYKKFIVQKRIKKLVENLKNETESIKKATGILEYSFVLGGVQKQQQTTGIKANLCENDTVKEESCKTLRNDFCEADNTRSVTRSLKLLAPKYDGVHWLGLFLQTFLCELTIIACFFDDYMTRGRTIPLAIVLSALGVGLFLSCLCRLIFFVLVTDFAGHNYGIYIANMLFKLWWIAASCNRLLLSPGILTFHVIMFIIHVIPIFMVICVYVILLISHILPFIGSLTKLYFARAFGVVQKVGLVMSSIVLAVTDYIMFTLYEWYENSSIHRQNVDTFYSRDTSTFRFYTREFDPNPNKWWSKYITVIFFVHTCSHLVLISSFGLRYVEIRKRGRSDFGWFWSNKSLSDLKQTMLLRIREIMPRSN